ncbi:MAG TPA: hypothetical protein VF771_02925, partial [Longimicrobiaceae bacterium]
AQRNRGGGPNPPGDDPGVSSPPYLEPEERIAGAAEDVAEVARNVVTYDGDLPDAVKVELDGQARPIRVETVGVSTVQLQRAGYDNPASLPLWVAIDLHTEYVSYNHFQAFVDRIFCRELPLPPGKGLDVLTQELRERRRNPQLSSYELLMRAAEVFLLTQAGVWKVAERIGSPDELLRATVTIEGRTQSGVPEPARAPVPREALRLMEREMTFGELNDTLQQFLGNDVNNYLETVLEANYDEGRVNVSPFCPAYLDPTGPYLLELIWSYWMEEAMLAQAIAAINIRFQNVRRPGRDPLLDLTLDPLRPLNNFLWGYIQNETKHLSVARRAYEYNHQYGFGLYGRAVSGLRPADPRVNFLSSFHNLLRQCALFYTQDADTTVIADAFPVLNALKDLNLVLSQGADNQFRDLPWQARAEMLVQQWLLARPEMREFLHGKPMVAYPEPWMPRLDALRQRMGWGATSVTYFRDLARFGERILLSVRYGNWTSVSDQDVARTWARYWKPEVQGYIYAYQMVTGVDLGDDGRDALSSEMRYALPSQLLLQRAQQQAQQQQLQLVGAR